jgi:hypothetical protein
VNKKILAFRDSCAEDGVELTPAQAKKMFKVYVNLKDEIDRAVKECPSFYHDLCNRTTEEKLRDMANIEKCGGEAMSLKEYNELQSMIKKICELEGYNS